MFWGCPSVYKGKQNMIQGRTGPLKEEDKEFISCAWAKMFMYVGHQAEILRWASESLWSDTVLVEATHLSDWSWNKERMEPREDPGEWPCLERLQMTVTKWCPAETEGEGSERTGVSEWMTVLPVRDILKSKFCQVVIRRISLEATFARPELVRWFLPCWCRLWMGRAKMNERFVIVVVS